MTVAALCRAIEAYTGTTTANDALGWLVKGYLRVLSGEDPREGAPPHNWSFLRPMIGQITVGAAVAATSATSVSGTVTCNTPAAGIFDQSMIGQAFTVTNYDGAGGVLTTTVTGYVSPTVITTDDTTSYAAKAASVASSCIVALPADFDGMVDGPVYTGTANAMDLPNFSEVSPEQLYEIWRMQNGQAPYLNPSYWAILPLPFVPATGSRYALGFASVPQEAVTLFYRYNTLQPDIVDDTAGTSPTFLPGGPSMQALYEWAGKAEWESQRNVTGVASTRFSRLMATAIDRDATKTSLGQDSNAGY
jgi:hypothetical protein